MAWGLTTLWRATLGQGLVSLRRLPVVFIVVFFLLAGQPVLWLGFKKQKLTNTGTIMDTIGKMLYRTAGDSDITIGSSAMELDYLEVHG